MPGLIFILLILIPIVELYVIVQIAQGIGLVPTLALMIGISMAGAWLLKREGVATWARLQQTLSMGKMPTNEVTDGALIMVGGALLLTPGFVSDVIGLIFLIPPTRAIVKTGARKVFGRWARRRGGVVIDAGSKVYEAGVVRRSTAAQRPTTTEDPPPQRLPGSDEGDSPDRG